MEERWELRRDEEVVGRVVVTDSDFPWLIGRFEAEPGFADLRMLFDEESRLSLEVAEARSPEEVDRAVENADIAYERIRAAVQLYFPDGRAVPEFLLRIEGDHASFRWNDAAFNDPEPRGASAGPAHG